MRISFGPFAFDRQSRLLWRDGNEIALPPRVLGVLELLIDRAGQVVARQDLLDAVWKDAFVTDTSLAEAISYLRQALGDDPQAPRYIQTVHRRGYRFLAVVAATPGTNWGLTSDQHFAASSAGARSAASEDAKTAIVWQLVPALAALLCGALLGTIVWRTTRTPAPEPLVARFEVAPAPETTFDRRAPALAVAADGRAIAWSACERSAACALYTRSVDRLEVVRLAGSEDASGPFFSPDGRWIGFFAAGKLKKIPVSGGSASILADAPAPGGASWGPDGRIAFAGSRAGGISLVSEDGAGITLTTPRADRGEVRHVYPAWLPRGGLLFTVLRTSEPDAPGELSAMAASARDWKTLRGGVTRATLAAPGYLLLSTGSDLQAATFDETALALTGGADSILASVSGGRSVTDFAIGGGTLVAATTSPAADAPRFAWADGADATALARLRSLVISPDSRRAAGVITDGGSDIWMADLGSGTLTRMTFEGSNVSPAWSADGSRLYFATRTSGAFGLAMRRLDDRAVLPIRTTTHEPVFPSSVAADGRIAVTAVGADGHTAVGIVSSTGTLNVLAAGPFDEASPAFSADGAWLAFESTESGRTEIVARGLGDERRIPVSNDGGARPRWSADGRWIYFDAGQRLMRAAFDPAAGSVRAPEAVDAGHGRAIAVTPAGRVLIAGSADSADRALVVLQWLRELRQRLPLPVAAPR